MIVGQDVAFMVQDEARPLPLYRNGTIEEVMHHRRTRNVHNRRQSLLVHRDVLLLFHVERRCGRGFGQRKITQRPGQRILCRPVRSESAMHQSGQCAGRHVARGEIVEGCEDQKNKQNGTQFHRWVTLDGAGCACVQDSSGFSGGSAHSVTDRLAIRCSARHTSVTRASRAARSPLLRITMQSCSWAVDARCVFSLRRASISIAASSS